MTLGQREAQSPLLSVLWQRGIWGSRWFSRGFSHPCGARDRSLIPVVLQHRNKTWVWIIAG